MGDKTPEFPTYTDGFGGIDVRDTSATEAPDAAGYDFDDIEAPHNEKPVAEQPQEQSK